MLCPELAYTRRFCPCICTAWNRALQTAPGPAQEPASSASMRPVGVKQRRASAHGPVQARRTRMASGARLCSTPRVLGTTQYVQRSLQPWMTLTQALSALSRRGTAMSSGMATGSTATTCAPRSTCSSSSPILPRASLGA